MQNNKGLITKKKKKLFIYKSLIVIPNIKEKKRKRKGKGKVKTQMSLMVAMHTNPNRIASSHVASMPRVAIATATATINGTRPFTNVCLSICCTLQLY